MRGDTQQYIFYVSPESIIDSLGCTTVGEQSQKHQFGAGVQIWWFGAQDRSLLKPRGTRRPCTKYPHGGTGNPEGGALS